MVHNPAVQLFKVSLQSQIKTNTQKVLTLTSTSARQFNIGIGSFLSLFYQEQLQNQKIPVSRLAARMLLCRQQWRLQTHGAQYKHVTVAGGSLVCSVQYFTLCAEYIPSTRRMLRIFSTLQIMNQNILETSNEHFQLIVCLLMTINHSLISGQQWSLQSIINSRYPYLTVIQNILALFISTHACLYQ